MAPNPDEPTFIERKDGTLVTLVPDDLKKFICDICGKKFSTTYLRKKHQLIHFRKGTEFICKCGKQFFYYPGFMRHKQIHIEITKRAPAFQRNHLGLYVCYICSKAYLRKDDCIEHEKTHKVIKNYILHCYCCNNEYADLASLNEHLMEEGIRRNDDGRFGCKFCDLTFASKFTADRHKQEVHENKAPELKFVCQYCDKKFRRNYDLKRHEKVHTRELERKAENES